jgi:precorrin-6B methylase 2
VRVGYVRKVPVIPCVNEFGCGTVLQVGKVAGSFPVGVIGIFHSGRTMALESNQAVTELRTRNTS